MNDEKRKFYEDYADELINKFLPYSLDIESAKMSAIICLNQCINSLTAKDPSIHFYNAIKNIINNK